MIIDKNQCKIQKKIYSYKYKKVKSYMGINFQTLDLLKKNIDEFGQLGDVLTLGRLGNQVDKKNLKLLNLQENVNFKEKYSEKILINYLKAKSVDSIDNSSFEEASIIQDMNIELEKLDKQYDTIIDFGTSEHIFNINQNLINISKLCKKGGKIIHCLPANNQCGHGFWQFSPELFFSIYSEANGYISTKLNLIDNHDHQNYWEIKRGPENERLELNSFTPLYIFVSTKKAIEKPTIKAQQTDYTYLWNKESESINAAVIKKSFLSSVLKRSKDKIKKYLREKSILKFFYVRYENKRLFLKNFYKRNNNLIKLKYNIKNHE